MTQRAIAARLGINVATVNHHIQEIRRRWDERRDGATDQHISHLLAQAEHLERLAFEEFHKSRLDKKRYKVKTKKDTGSKDEAGETTTEADTEGRIGDPRLLATIQKSMEFRAKLLGLIKQEKHEHNTNNYQQIAIIEYPELPPREVPAIAEPLIDDAEVSYPLPPKATA